MAPSPGWFRINSDPAIDVRNVLTSFGIVIRNDAGRVVLSCVVLQRLVALDIAEAMALLRDVQLALDYGFIRFAVRQIANLVAHSLAIFAPSLVSDYILFDDVPSSVLYLVSKDICG
ncbi:hypothetical protein ACOSQ4_016580 [Xanthoceras sorbifolium]